MTKCLALSFQSCLAKHRHVLWTSSTLSQQQIGDFLSAYVLVLPVSTFKQRLAPLKLGRFYPAMILDTEEDLPGGLFRVIKLNDHDFTADFNHPLAGLAHTFSQETITDRASGSAAPAELIHWAGIETPLGDDLNFSEPEPLARDDKEVDTEFYATPRKVMHVDSVCAERITAFYRRHLSPEDAVLDLMASWRSHLPEEHSGPVTGLGMNSEELSDNSQLQSFVLFDLNTASRIPFENGSFDAVTNTVSIEYLTRPLAILHDVRRILKPGGKLLITFSNRFFPSKATTFWKHLHPVERMGWVVQCLHTAGFTDIQTQVERGLKRDPNDRYAPQLKEMDPLFTICAQRPAHTESTTG